MERTHAIARSLVPGARSFSSFGERTSSGAETNAPIRTSGAIVLIDPAGVQMSIVSASASDTSNGTNARTVLISYLDTNLAEQTEVVTLAGLTPVSTVATNIRYIQGMRVASYGATSSAAAGAISASNGGTTYASIPAGEVRTRSSFRMVPVGKKLLVGGVVGSSISGAGQARSVIKLVASEIDGVQTASPFILFPVGSLGMQDSAATMVFPVPPSFTAGTVVGFLHTSDKACTVSGSWFGHLEDA